MNIKHSYAFTVATRAWSAWLIALLLLCQVAHSTLPLINVAWGLPPKLYAILMIVITAGAMVSRMVPQKKLQQRLASFWSEDSGAVKIGKKTGIAGTAGALALAVTFIGGWEGLRTEAYQDVVGVWTVCYGETKGVQPGDSYSKADCDRMLVQEILEYEDGLDKCLTAPVPVGMKIALTSWAYNVGPGAACRSTLVRKANAGDLRGACDELPRWNRAGGRVIRGLTNRRVSERALCFAALKAAA